jgi:uncharacterized membrane protein YkoI
MRFFLLSCLLCISSAVLADGLLLPDNITPETKDNAASSLVNDQTLTNNESAKKESITPKLSAAEAAVLVAKEFSGQIMSVTLLDTNKTPTYGVKILKSGHMKTIYVDANTGRFSKLSD